MMAEEGAMSTCLKVIYFIAILTIIIGVIALIVITVVFVKPKIWHDYLYEELR